MAQVHIDCVLEQQCDSPLGDCKIACSCQPCATWSCLRRTSGGLLVSRRTLRTARGTLTPGDHTYARRPARSPSCRQMHSRCGGSCRQYICKMCACRSGYLPAACSMFSCTLQDGWVLDIAEVAPLDDPTGTTCCCHRSVQLCRYLVHWLCSLCINITPVLAPSRRIQYHWLCTCAGSGGAVRL